VGAIIRSGDHGGLERERRAEHDVTVFRDASQFPAMSSPSVHAGARVHNNASRTAPVCSCALEHGRLHPDAMEK